MKPKKFEIKQLMPAIDWFAVYIDYIEGGEPGALTCVPLVGWAVVPNYYLEGDDGVVPMVQTLDCGVEAADSGNFCGVVHASQRDSLEEWVERPIKIKVRGGAADAPPAE